MKTEGQADVTVDIVDVSALISTGLKGITGLFGVTERGEVGKPKLIGTWEAFQDSFGGLLDEDDFPLYCKRALESGGKIKVGRVGHYTDVTQPSTLVGTKATLSKAVSVAVAETRATATITVTTAGTAGNTYTIMVLQEGGIPRLIGKATVVGSDTTTLVAGRIIAAINANTAFHGYTAANTGAVVTVTAPAGSGASANTYTFDNDATGTVAATVTAFASGVSAAEACVLSLSADSIGTWANNKLYAYATASKVFASKWDLVIGLDGNDRVTKTISSIPLNPTSPQLASYNALLKGLAVIDSITTMGAFVAGIFSGGAEDKTLITYLDHIGDSAAKTGMYMYNESTDFVKLGAPSYAMPVLDIALAAYANYRRDFMSLHRTPVGVGADVAIDYREGAGSYSHAPINSWRSVMFTGGIRAAHPVTGAELSLGELGDFAGICTKKDSNVGSWWSFGGSKRGLVSNALGVVVNFRSPALKLEGDNISIHGINAVVEHETFGTVFWDNMTLYKSSTLLKFANVAELLIFMTRSLKPLIESEQFDPNDIETWKQVYRNVKPLLQTIKDGRGIWDYLYQGDQDIDDISEAVVNQPTNIDAGAYKFRLFIQPKVAMKFVGVEVVVTNSGVDFNELISQGV